MPMLTVAISTYAAHGIQRVAAQHLPLVEGVEYVVSWQEHDNLPVPTEIKERRDIRVCRFDEKGQSANRNNSVAKSNTDIVLIADDDIAYTPEALTALIEYYDANPDADICTVKVVRPGSTVWPDVVTPLHDPLPKNYSPGACEISFRKSRIGNLIFHPEFGLNSPRMHCGEDSLFLFTAIKRGLNCRFVPITVGSHPHDSTGDRLRMKATTLRGEGCLIKFYYPYSFWLRIPLKASRLSRHQATSFFKSLFYMAHGAFIGIRMLLSRNRSLLWPKN